MFKINKVSFLHDEMKKGDIPIVNTQASFYYLQSNILKTRYIFC